MRRTTLAATGLLTISALTLTGCAGSLRSAAPETSPSAAPSTDTPTPESASPSPTRTSAAPKSNEWGDPNPPTFIDDEMENIVMYFPEAASHDAKTISVWIEDVCYADMNNGGGYNYLAKEEGFTLSSFFLSVSSLGEVGTEPYAFPKVLAHHFCPTRERHVYAVQKYEEANEASE